MARLRCGWFCLLRAPVLVDHAFRRRRGGSRSRQLLGVICSANPPVIEPGCIGEHQGGQGDQRPAVPWIGLRLPLRRPLHAFSPVSRLSRWLCRDGAVPSRQCPVAATSRWRSLGAGTMGGKPGGSGTKQPGDGTPMISHNASYVQSGTASWSPCAGSVPLRLRSASMTISTKITDFRRTIRPERCGLTLCYGALT